jgi:hypothetical protein
MTATVPTADEVRVRFGLPVEVVPEEELDDVLAQESDAQAKSCRIDPYGYDLRGAIFRRVQRALAAKGVPLGVLADEFGSSPLVSTDAEITRLEGPYQKFNIGTTRAGG